jgi:kumamolisin
MEQRVAIPGSAASDDTGGSWVATDGGEQLSPTILIRRPAGAGDLSQRLLAGSRPQLSREEAAQFMRVNPADLAAVAAFAHDYGLKIVSENAEARTMSVEGSAAQVGKAFGIKIEWRIDPQGHKYLSYQGELTTAAPLAGIIEAVLGLDQRPIARRVGQ